MTGNVYQDLQALIQRVGSVTIRAKMNPTLCRPEFHLDFTDPDVAPDKSHQDISGAGLELTILRTLAYEQKRKNGQATPSRKKPKEPPTSGAPVRARR